MTGAKKSNTANHDGASEHPITELITQRHYAKDRSEQGIAGYRASGGDQAELLKVVVRSSVFSGF